MNLRKALKLFARQAARPALILATMAVLTASLSASAQDFSASAIKQMQEVAAIKHSLTAAEKKMSSSLVLLSRAANHTLPADLLPLVSGARLDAKGNAMVEVNGYMTSALLSHPGMAGVDKVNGQIRQADLAAGRVRASVHPLQLLSLASSPDVKSLREPSGATTNIGSLTSQGYVAHGANKVIATGVKGAGVRVGVLSDSASPARVAALIASGDLPPDVVVVPGHDGVAQGGEDEGTAMMEIVHDLAPGAKLFFASAFESEAQFAANIVTLSEVYHCNIIVDDVSYFDEAAFQDGIVAKAVNTVTAEGVLYFSSSANSGNLTSGTSGTWEGDFNNGGPAAGYLAGVGLIHNFAPSGTQLFDRLSGATNVISLKWSDPLGGAADDYDLYILNSTGTSLIGYSGNTQDGTQDPVEIAGTNGSFPVNTRVVVALYAGAARALHVDTNRGRLTIATAGSTYGHNAAANTFTTAAVYWNSAHTGPRLFVGGAANPIETFSSDGPRQIFFQPNGTPITPGNYLFATNGGTTLAKPDASAADGVSTATPLFNPFFGTSAAAPHAAAMAALVKSANPSLTNVQIRAILKGTTLDIMAPGWDRDSGTGIVMALPAVQAAH